VPKLHALSSYDYINTQPMLPPLLSSQLLAGIKGLAALLWKLAVGVGAVI
jgi:hypothetical protein